MRSLSVSTMAREDLNHLCDVCYLYAVRMIVEDIQVDTGDNRIAQRVLLVKRSLVLSRLRVIPGPPFIHHQAERREAEQIELPNKRAAELLKIKEKEADAYQDYANTIDKINGEQRQREEEDDAKLAEMRRKALEQEPIIQRAEAARYRESLACRSERPRPSQSAGTLPNRRPICIYSTAGGSGGRS